MILIYITTLPLSILNNVKAKSHDSKDRLFLFSDNLETIMTEVYFYHYTTEDAARRIVREGEIFPSVAAGGDAVHGEGVYLTTLDPRP